MKKLIPIVLFLLTSFFAYSGNIDKDKLIQYGINAFEQRSAAANQKATAKNTSIKHIDYITQEEDTLLLIFNFSPEGFLILSTQENTQPVWGYSTEGNLDAKKLHPGIRFLIEGYKEEIADLKRSATPATPSVREAWEKIKITGSKSETSSVIVPPMITATWNQDKYYNQLSPVDAASPNGYDSRVPNGCVALAMAMIMYYYRYPVSGEGSHTNNAGKYGNLSVNFAEQIYRYDAMQDKLTNFNHEVAKLIFHCATSVDMNYAPDGSGAQSYRAAEALKTYFKYSSEVEEIDKRSYSNSEWKNIIIDQLNNKYPVYYAGCDKDGCHAFVCDGYDQDSLFHFNFGWGGHGNGYFPISSAGTSAGGYSRMQSAIINIFPRAPYPQYCSGTTLITAVNGTLEDGSNSENYAHNSNCTYVIAPPNATAFTIRIQELKTEANNDVLRFWKGHPSGGNLVHTFSGELKDHPFTVETDSLYITFTSNESVTDAGWRLEFQVERDVAGCNNNTDLFTEHSGTIEDGSGDKKYASNSECIWAIRPSGSVNDYNSITLNFEKFDLKPEDHIIIHNVYGEKTILDIFDGNTIPPASVVYRTPRINIEFRSDNFSEGDGFVIHWETATVGINTLNKEKLTVYPNPAMDHFTVKLPDHVSGNWKMNLYDITGRTLQNISLPGGESEVRVNTSGLPAGFYWIRLYDGKTEYTQKIVIRK